MQSVVVDVDRIIEFISSGIGAGFDICSRGGGCGFLMRIPRRKIGKLVDGCLGILHQPVHSLAGSVISKSVLNVVKLDGSLSGETHTTISGTFSSADLQYVHRSDHIFTYSITQIQICCDHTINYFTVPVFTGDRPHNVTTFDCYDLTAILAHSIRLAVVA